MQLDLAAMQAKISQPVEIEVPDEGTLTIRFYPHRYTNPVHNKLVQLSKQPELDPLVDMLAELLAGWDLLSDGKELKVSKDVLSRLPISLLVEMGQAIVNHVTASKNAKGSPSA